jgi:hypothetical protein
VLLFSLCRLAFPGLSWLFDDMDWPFWLVSLLPLYEVYGLAIWLVCPELSRLALLACLTGYENNTSTDWPSGSSVPYLLRLAYLACLTVYKPTS